MRKHGCMRSSIRTAGRLLGALLLAALLLAACGDSADDEYRDELPRIDRRLAALARDVGNGLRSAGEVDDSALAGEFGGYARRLGRLRERLDQLDAPDRLAMDHAKLLAAMAAVSGALADVESAARRSDATAARAAAVRLVRGGERLDQARRELARAVR